MAAIGEWAGDAPCQVLAALGVRRDPLTGAWRPPGEATVRRVLVRIDADALDRAIGAWLAAQPPPPASPSPPTPHPGRRAVAVDGKTLRGSSHQGAAPVHLLAVMDHTTGAVLGQADVDGKTNEITRFRPLLEGLDLAGRVVTADALHTQREHADWLVTVKHAAYVLIVKANQPTLHHQLVRLPWREVPVADHTRDRGHARVEIRRLQVTTVTGLDFPHATQAIRITRRVRPLAGRRWRTVTVYAVTSLTAAQASPARLADWIRGHWGIEVLHHIRDVTFAEDASQAAPATPHEPWPACATSPSASCAPAATATSPPRCAATPATPPESCHSSASPAREPDTPAPCRGPAATRRAPGPPSRLVTCCWGLGSGDDMRAFLLHDRDAKFCRSFGEVFRSEGAEVLLTPVQAPRANASAERRVRTVRAECLDWLLIVGRGHLEQVLKVYIQHDNTHRPHRALRLKPPDPLPVRWS